MTKKPFAVFTLAHNEGEFLPIWLHYYSRFFAPEDIYILNHDSTDGSTIAAKQLHGVNVVAVHHPSVHDNRFMLAAITQMQHQLMGKYEAVVYSDSDELVMTDPLKYADLGEYLSKYRGDYSRCASRSVMQQQNEPEIDLSAPILAQRSTWFEEIGYDKVLVSRKSLRWSMGLHSLIDESGAEFWPPQDDGLILLHLARIDLALKQKRTGRIMQEQWGGRGPEAFQHRLSGTDLLYWFFFFPAKDAELQGKPYFREQIPDRFRQII